MHAYLLCVHQFLSFATGNRGEELGQEMAKSERQRTLQMGVASLYIEKHRDCPFPSVAFSRWYTSDLRIEDEAIMTMSAVSSIGVAGNFSENLDWDELVSLKTCLSTAKALQSQLLYPFYLSLT